MKSDRMAAFEAPRAPIEERELRDIELHFRGNGRGPISEIVRIPRAMPSPELITYHGHTFVRRTAALYAEASMWPILDELDGR